MKILQIILFVVLLLLLSAFLFLRLPLETTEALAEPTPSPAALTPVPTAEPEAVAPAETFAPEKTPAPITEEETAAEETPAESAAPKAGDFSDLQSLLTEQISAYGGTWEIYVKNLDTGVSIGVGGGPMVAASLIKLYVAGAYCQAVADGTIADSCSDVLDAMIYASDNEACNAIVRALGNGDAAAGMAAVNAFASARGCVNTQMNRLMLDFSSATENYTSATECGNVLEDIYSSRYVSQSVSSALLSDLFSQQRRWKIPAGVPDGVRVANKTGELSNVENDAALVFSPGGTYILCVLSSGVNAGTAQAQIVQISQTVYAYFNS